MQRTSWNVFQKLRPRVSLSTLAHRVLPYLREHGLAATLRRSAEVIRLEYFRPVVLDMVTLEITTYCNLRCPGCSRTVYGSREDWTNSHLTIDQYKSLIDQLPPTRQFCPQGIGEPTLHPHLPELIAIAKQSGKFREITIASNVMGRDLDYYVELFANGLTKLYISVDSLDPLLAETLRAGTKVDVLKQRIAELTTRFPKQIIVRTTVGQANVDNVPQILKELNELGHVAIIFHAFYDSGHPDWCLSNEQKAQFENSLPQMAAEFPNLEVSFENFTPSEAMCLSPWRSPNIMVDGRMSPCCLLGYHPRFDFGNVFETSFDAVWHSKEAEAWRSAFTVQSPEVCKNCPSYLPRGQQ